MNARLVNELRAELVLRGAGQDGTLPSGTMIIGDDDLADFDLARMFDLMVSRREKIYRSVPAVGAKVAREGYDDVVLVIEAIKAVIAKMSLP